MNAGTRDPRGAGEPGSSVTGTSLTNAAGHRPPPKLLDRLGHALRVRHYSPRTEQAYRYWVRRFILFHGKRHPSGLGAAEIEAFLNHLAVEEQVAASTQNQALNADHLSLPPRAAARYASARASGSRAQAAAPAGRADTARGASVLARLEGTSRLVAGLLYGSGLRLLECLELRVKDVDFEQAEIRLRDGKGRKDRVTPLPRALVEPLRTQLRRACATCTRGSRAGLRRGAAAVRAGAEVSERRARVGLAVRLPGDEPRSRTGRAAPSGAITTTRRRCSAR